MYLAQPLPALHGFLYFIVQWNVFICYHGTVNVNTLVVNVGPQNSRGSLPYRLYKYAISVELVLVLFYLHVIFKG